MNDPTTVKIYALIDPRTSMTFYIGRSYDPEKRLKLHKYECTARRIRYGPFAKTFRELAANGAWPRLVILQICSTDGYAEEKAHIRLAKLHGIPLTNASDGCKTGPGILPGRKRLIEEFHARVQTN